MGLPLAELSKKLSSSLYFKKIQFLPKRKIIIGTIFDTSEGLALFFRIAVCSRVGLEYHRYLLLGCLKLFSKPHALPPRCRRAVWQVSCRWDEPF